VARHRFAVTATAFFRNRAGLSISAACAVTIAASGVVGAFVGHARAAFPDANGRIVFAAAPANNQTEYAIYTMKPVEDGSVDKGWKENPTGSNPKWSRWGSRIAFVRGPEGKREIYLMNADGTGVTRLTKNSDDDINPSWSPNDEWIAFATNRDGNYEIYKMRVDGPRTPKNLTKSAVVRNEDPAWSPDGKRIAFQSDGQIQVMSADGTGKKPLTNTGLNVSPAWSPDGKRIAFATRPTEKGNYDIYVMNADGTSVTNLTSDPADCGPTDLKRCSTDLDPTWSPDGTLIAFTSNRRGISAIHVMSKNGGDPKLLTPLDRASTTSDWKPADPATPQELRNRVESGVIKIKVAGDCHGFGTGFLVGPDLVATADHVLDESEKVFLVRNSEQLEATIVGRAPRIDIALLRSPKRINGYRFTFAGRRAREGERATAFGYSETGPATKKDGDVQSINATDVETGVGGLIQFDQSVPPGYSGGPLVRSPDPSDESGEADDVGFVLGLVRTTRKEGQETLAVPAAIVAKRVTIWRMSRKPLRPSEACRE